MKLSKKILGSLFLSSFSFLPINKVYSQQAGDLDISFGDYGKKNTDFNGSTDMGRSLDVQSDGKIVMGGWTRIPISNGANSDFAIARYNKDGSLDNTFSGDGKQTTAIGSSSDECYSVKVQSDGKILAAGGTYDGSSWSFAIARYNTDGSLDITFSGDGKQITDFGIGDEIGYSISVQSDGKIVVSGSAKNKSNSFFAIVRYNKDGSLDNTFSGGGKQTTSAGAKGSGGFSSCVQNDDKIIVAGWAAWGTSQGFAVVRYNKDGSLDNSFSSGGIRVTNVGMYTNSGWGGVSAGNSVVVQRDGKIVVAGWARFSFSPSGTEFTIVRYNEDGNLDNTFSSDGVQTANFGLGTNEANSVAVQPDGKIIVVGNSSGSEFTIVRYNEDGNLDNTFSNDGKQTTSIGKSGGSAYSVAIQTDGKILVAGYANSDFTIARYNNSNKTSVESNINIYNTIKAFPNPTEGQLTIRIGDLPLSENYNLKITNMLFQTVFSTQINNQDFILDLNSLGAKGMYLLQICDRSKKIGEIKIILQ